MLPKLKISCFLMKRLERIKQHCSGCLFGVFYGDGTLLLMGFNVESTIGQLNYEQIQYKFPAELDLCGLVKFGDCSDAEAHLTEILKDVDITDNPILLNCDLGTLVGLKASIFMHEKLHEIPFEVMQADELYRDFCFSRLRCSFNLYTESTAEAVSHNIHNMRKNLSSGCLAFNVASTNIFVTGAGAHSSTITNKITNDSKIMDITYASLTVDKVNSPNGEKSQSALTINNEIENKINTILGGHYEVIDVDVLRNKSKERNVETGSPPSAMSMCVRREDKKVCVPLDIEAIAILFKSTKLNRFYDILIESICRSLRLYEQSIVERILESDTKKLMVPQIYHFFPLEFGHFLSCAYLHGVSDDDTLAQQKRKKLHHHFGLSISRPYFRRANRCLFKNDITTDELLMNPHLGLRSSGITDGRQYLVQGNYKYYHYTQQDKGWGCAYRSLQTICSWFSLQGYTEREIPTHLEIQKYLVYIGDKPASFVGSTKWIGSTEVSMCLQGFINVDSKIQHVTSGADIGTLGPELATHFQSQGTPIMIGGGVLAHTILGVDFNAQIGQIKFLILDPHYTGEVNLHTIQAKGWCGWKGADFWDKKSYYNLCMPQRPNLY